MPKAPNKLAELKDSILKVGASLRRSKMAMKPIDKIGNIDYTHLLNEIIAKQEMLQLCLEKDLRLEQRRVKVPSVIRG